MSRIIFACAFALSLSACAPEHGVDQIWNLPAYMGQAR